MKAIAVCALSNTGGLAMYDVNDEKALIGYNQESPEWYDVEFLKNEDNEGSEDLEPHVLYGELKIPLGNFMRV